MIRYYYTRCFHLFRLMLAFLLTLKENDELGQTKISTGIENLAIKKYRNNIIRR